MTACQTLTCTRGCSGSSAVPNDQDVSMNRVGGERRGGHASVAVSGAAVICKLH